MLAICTLYAHLRPTVHDHDNNFVLRMIYFGQLISAVDAEGDASNWNRSSFLRDCTQMRSCERQRGVQYTITKYRVNKSLFITLTPHIQDT